MRVTYDEMLIDKIISLLNLLKMSIQILLPLLEHLFLQVQVTDMLSPIHHECILSLVLLL